jgi:hypothetical protein
MNRVALSKLSIALTLVAVVSFSVPAQAGSWSEEGAGRAAGGWFAVTDGWLAKLVDMLETVYDKSAAVLISDGSPDQDEAGGAAEAAPQG